MAGYGDNLPEMGIIYRKIGIFCGFYFFKKV